MGISVSSSHALEHLAEIWNEVEDTRDAAVIQRRGHEDMVLIPAGELASLRETAYLLRSPASAARLLSALTRARKGGTKLENLTELRKQLVLDDTATGDGPWGVAMAARKKRGAVLQDECREDLRFWVDTNRELALRVLDLREGTVRETYSGIGKPEHLKHMGGNFWSRRITEVDRLVH